MNTPPIINANAVYTAKQAAELWKQMIEKLQALLGRM